MIKVSIVVPIYNVEKYIKRCLDSLNEQDMKDIEIILVDDGSTDNSGVIAKKYTKKHKKFTYIHKDNGGLSSARNAGLDIAKGEYIGFIDSDDYIEKDMFSYLYKNAKKYNSDIATCGFTVIYENGKAEKITKELKDVIYTQKEAMDIHLFSGYIDDICCNKIYKKEIFDEIRFEPGKLYEDMLIMPKLLSKCKTISLHTDSKYNYCKRSDSIGGTKFSNKTLYLIEACQNNVSYCLSKHNDLKDIFIAQILWDLVVINKMALANVYDSKLIKKIKQKIRKNIHKVIICDKIELKRKIQIFLFLFNYKLYRIVYLKYYSNNRI